jgi:hypothetical protein
MKKQLLTLALLGFCALPAFAQVTLRGDGPSLDAPAPTSPALSEEDKRLEEFVSMFPVEERPALRVREKQRRIDRQAEQAKMSVLVQKLADSESQFVLQAAGKMPDAFVQNLIFTYYAQTTSATGTPQNSDAALQAMARLSFVQITQSQKLIEQNEQIIALLKAQAKK